MSIAITGGRGFLGREFCLQAAAQGHKLCVLTSRSLSPENGFVPPTSPNISYLHGDLLGEEKKTRRVLAELLDKKDILFHLAGQVSRSESDTRSMMRLHIEGTRRIFSAAAQKKVEKIVLLSTSGVVGVSSKGTPASDNSPYALEDCLRWPYYASKLFQEKSAILLAKEKKLRLLVLRPSLFLGPGDTDFSSTSDIKDFLERRIPAVPQGGLSFLDVRDAATAALQAAAKGFDNIQSGDHRTYLLGAANLTFSAFMQKLSQLSGVPQPRFSPSRQRQLLGAKLLRLRSDSHSVFFAPKLSSAALEMANFFWYIDCNRAKKELEWKPRPIDETLKDTIDFIQNNSQSKRSKTAPSV